MTLNGAQSSVRPGGAPYRGSAAEDADDDWGRGDDLLSGEAVTLDVRSASYLQRAGSALLDWLLYVALYLVLMLLATALGASAGADDAFYRIAQIVLLVTCGVVAPFAHERIGRGQTLGMLAAGIRVVRDDGGPVQLRHSLVRAIVGIPDFILTLGGLAALAGLTTAKSRRLGDILAGTHAQSERGDDQPSMFFPLPPGLEAWAATADVARMPASLARRIRQYLAQNAQLSPMARQMHAQSLAAEAARYVSPWPNVPADYAIAAINAVRRDREARALEISGSRRRQLGPVLDALPNGFPER